MHVIRVVFNNAARDIRLVDSLHNDDNRIFREVVKPVLHGFPEPLNGSVADRLRLRFLHVVGIVAVRYNYACITPPAYHIVIIFDRQAIRLWGKRMVDLDRSDPAEEWRAVVGFERLYDVSSFGRVRSLGRTVMRVGKRGGMISFPPKLMTLTPNQGYPRVTFRINGKTIYRLVHQLVAEAFIGPCPSGQEVRHKSPDRSNARADHLEYGTRMQNIFDTKAQGRFRNGASHLTEDMVRQIASRHDDTARLLACEFGVSMGTIAGIRSRKVWTHLDLPLRDSYVRRGNMHPARRGKQKLPDPQIIRSGILPIANHDAVIRRAIENSPVDHGNADD